MEKIIYLYKKYSSIFISFRVQVSVNTFLQNKSILKQHQHILCHNFVIVRNERACSLHRVVLCLWKGFIFKEWVMLCLVLTSALHFHLNYYSLRMQIFLCVSVKQASITLTSTGKWRVLSLYPLAPWQALEERNWTEFLKRNHLAVLCLTENTGSLLQNKHKGSAVILSV